LKLITYIKVILPFVAALEHISIYTKFMDKLISKQRELREIEEAMTMGSCTLVRTKNKEHGWWKKR